MNLSYEITHMKLPKPRLLHSWDSATALTLLYTKMRINKTNTNSFKSITNNISPFVSKTWHHLGSVVYSYCPTNDSYNICIHSYCLPCNYVTEPFWAYCRGYLRVKGCTYIIWTRQKLKPFLSEKLKQLNFQKFLGSNFQV